MTYGLSLHVNAVSAASFSFCYIVRPRIIEGIYEGLVVVSLVPIPGLVICVFLFNLTSFRCIDHAKVGPLHHLMVLLSL